MFDTTLTVYTPADTIATVMVSKQIADTTADIVRTCSCHVTDALSGQGICVGTTRII